MTLLQHCVPAGFLLHLPSISLACLGAGAAGGTGPGGMLTDGAAGWGGWALDTCLDGSTGGD